MSDSAMMSHLLEGDGIIPNLFYFLWKRGASHKESPATDFAIPSTVIFEHNFPKAWYYHSGSELERRLGKDIDSIQILRDFCHRGSSGGPRPPEATDKEKDGRTPPSTMFASNRSAQQPTGPLALLRGGGGGNNEPADNHTGEVVATFFSTVEVNGEPCTRVEYLDREALEEFLVRRTRRPDGFLQKWVAPPGKHNTVIEAIWSPHLSIVSKRQNSCAARDRRYPMYDRCVTYEGATHRCTDVFVAPHVQWQVKSICQGIVDHIHSVQRISLQRMVLYFKVDQHSRIWLLWGGSMRVSDRSQLNLAPRFVQPQVTEGSEEQSTAQRIASLIRDPEELQRTSGTLARGPNSVPTGSALLGSSPQRSGRNNGSTTQQKAEKIRFPQPPQMGGISEVYASPAGFNKRFLELQLQQLKAIRKERKAARRSHAKGVICEDKLKQELLRLAAAEEHRLRYLNTPGIVDDELLRKARVTQQGKRRRKSSSASNRTKPRSPSEDSASIVTGGSGSRATTSRNASLRGTPRTYATPIVPPMEPAIVAPTNRRVEAIDDFTMYSTRPQARPASYLWSVARLAVFSGYIRHLDSAATHGDWLDTLLYCAYSHFLCSTHPMTVIVPFGVTSAVATDPPAAPRTLPLRSATDGSVPVAKEEGATASDDADATKKTTSPATSPRLPPRAPPSVADDGDLAGIGDRPETAQLPFGAHPTVTERRRQTQLALQLLRSLGLKVQANRPPMPRPPTKGPSFHERGAAAAGLTVSFSANKSGSVTSPGEPTIAAPVLKAETSETDALLPMQREESADVPPPATTDSGRSTAESPASGAQSVSSPIPADRATPVGTRSFHGVLCSTVYVMALENPLAEIQQKLRDIMAVRVGKPAAVAKWFYTGHRWLMSREFARFVETHGFPERETEKKFVGSTDLGDDTAPPNESGSKTPPVGNESVDADDKSKSTLGGTVAAMTADSPAANLNDGSQSMLLPHPPPARHSD